MFELAAQQRPSARLCIRKHACQGLLVAQLAHRLRHVCLSDRKNKSRSRLRHRHGWNAGGVVRAIEVQGPGSQANDFPATPEQGQISREVVTSMKTSIAEQLQAERVDIADAYGDGRHVSIDVVASAFEGLNSMKRQRLVYKAIWLELQSTVHAVDAMTTKTPQEAGL